MTRIQQNTTKPHLVEIRDLLSAIIEGEQIQFLFTTTNEGKQVWQDLNIQVTSALFFDNNYTYRIKPKPREFVIAINKQYGNHVIAGPKGHYLVNPNDWDQIKVREVPE